MKNKVYLTGIFGKDAEIKDVMNIKMGLGSIYINEDYKKPNTEEWIKKGFWIDIKTFVQNHIRYFETYKKGDQISLEGRLVIDSYQNKEGKKMFYTCVELISFVKCQK